MLLALVLSLTQSPAFDFIDEQCPALTFEIGADTTVERLGSLPMALLAIPVEHPYAEREAGQTIVNLYDPQPVVSPTNAETFSTRVFDPPSGVMWIDGVLTSASLPDVWSLGETRRGSSVAPGVNGSRQSDVGVVEEWSRYPRPRERLVVDTVPRSWHDSVEFWLRSRNGRVAYGAQDGRAFLIVVDGVTIDVFPCNGRRCSPEDFAFSNDGLLFFWRNATEQLVKILTPRGDVVVLDKCYPAGGSIGVPGLAFFCYPSDHANDFVIIADKGEMLRFASAYSAKEWWLSLDRAHLITRADDQVTIDGVAGPRMQHTWNLVVDEQRRIVRYLGIDGNPHEGTANVLRVTTAWPADACRM